MSGKNNTKEEETVTTFNKCKKNGKHLFLFPPVSNFTLFLHSFFFLFSLYFFQYGILRGPMYPARPLCGPNLQLLLLG
jgi:hypothetical protein